VNGTCVVQMRTLRIILKCGQGAVVSDQLSESELYTLFFELGCVFEVKHQVKAQTTNHQLQARYTTTD
jgi:hypothetical protein